ncbi:3-keto-5-aminohexanoate cleavage protein [Rhodoligotrophos defluvii]|uniref:3-keto-5-aminohexanoate cleavage protein n=1 Tax=Rhodoligotrophos defluvii TaxID=2561934 RepID=UPI0010CA0C8B|nr:3-keto-5-aminohexanoate cleavage protein [Rhodoligotrophos defluvii]
MSRPVIICCAVTGSGDTVSKNPAVPVTPAQIARSALDAAAAGAAIVHIHVRDPETTKASLDLDLYRETVGLIRAENKDVVINLTTGTGARFVPGADDPRQPGPGTSLASPELRTRHIKVLKPDICSLDMGTMNMGDTVFMNTPGHLAEMAKVIAEAQVVPELEVFEAGHVRLATAMIERGQLVPPHLFQICLGVPWGQPATTEAMAYMKHMLPAGAQWFAFGIGLHQFPMVAQSVVLGGHVRVGLEDNLYLGRGQLAPSNAALVERAVRIVEAIGHPIATPAQAREIIGL